RVEKEAAIKAQDFEKAASLRDKEKQTKEKLDSILIKWREEREEKEVLVTADDMMHIISKVTGVPLQRMEQAETEKLLKMEEELKGKVIGQDEAVIAVSKALRRSRADLKDPRRPIGSFIFLGPTGVGKTFLAQKLAEFMFGDRDALIQIDMSEYMEKFTASRLIGSPPGYVGYEEGGQLSEAVRRRPYSVVLFDEIEKAHPDVMHLLLQIVDLEVEKVKVRLKAKEVEIVLDNLAHEFVIEKGYDPNYGARPMRRAVERFLEDPLAEEILRGNVKAGTKVNVTAKDAKLLFQSDVAKKKLAEPIAE